MQTGVVDIDHYQLLSEFHSGLADQECLIISQLTKDGNCVFLVCESGTTKVIDYHVYGKLPDDAGGGQILGGDVNDWETFKNSNYDLDAFV